MSEALAKPLPVEIGLVETPKQEGGNQEGAENRHNHRDRLTGPSACTQLFYDRADMQKP